MPGATHLFEEPGTLDEVMRHATSWFRRFLPQQLQEIDDDFVFADRRDAGRRLVPALMRFKDQNPIVLALPRGGVPVAFEVARALDAPLDVVLVRKIGAPGHEELGLGAVVDGANPQIVLNDEIVRAVGADPAYIKAATARQLDEIERRRRLYRGSEPPLEIAGRTVIVVDDGIATGGTVRAVLQALTRSQPRRLVLAVPVAPRETIEALRAEADEVICLLDARAVLCGRRALSRFSPDLGRGRGGPAARCEESSCAAAGIGPRSDFHYCPPAALPSPPRPPRAAAGSRRRGSR